MNNQTRPAVFISYSHLDERWKDALMTHLRVLDRQGIISLWDDRCIGAGEDWFKSIQNAINAAKIAILLISANFLTSDFILREEITLLLRRRDSEGLHIFPVLIKPCDWEAVSWLSQMNLRPKDARPLSLGNKGKIDSDLSEIARELRKLLSTISPVSLSRQFSHALPKVSIRRLPTTSRNLFGREQELGYLDAAWSDAATNLVVLVGWGGIGKSALIIHWIAQMAKDNYRSASKVFAWSFYSQGSSDQVVSADEFIDSSLRWFGDTEPPKDSAWAKGERLAQLIRTERAILILDGLEPLQYPPGVNEGRLKDQAMRALLRELAAQNSGLCIISTRVSVTDLEDFEGSTVQRIGIEKLLPETGSQILLDRGVKGDSAELRQAVIEFDGHPFALTLLGSFLSEVHNGDITKRDVIERLEDDVRQGGHAKRIFASYEKWFGQGPEIEVLRMLGLFDRPAEVEAITSVRGDPPISGLTDYLLSLNGDDWNRTLAKLRRSKLLAVQNEKQPNLIDTHPLVREHFGTQLRRDYPIAWKEGNSRLFDYFQKKAKHSPDNFEEMIPLYLAALHGCCAGRHQEVLHNVYWPRISRGDELFSARKLSAFGADLTVLSGFFEEPWTKPVSGIPETEVGLILGQVGLFLWAQGELAEAAIVTQRALELDQTFMDWYAAALAARNLSQYNLTLGNLNEALNYAKESVRLADRTGAPFERIVTRTALGDALHLVGQFSEAELAFNEASELEKKLDTESCLYWPKYAGLATISSSSSDRCYLYCDMLLDQKRYQEVKDKSEATLGWVIRVGSLPIDIGLIKLALGRAYLLEAIIESTNNFIEASKYLDDAVDKLRQAGTDEFLVHGLLAHAELSCHIKEMERARSDLDEALSIVTRSGMNLYIADCYLGYTRLYIALDNIKEAKENLALAKEKIHNIGCYRRDDDIRRLSVILDSETTECCS